MGMLPQEDTLTICRTTVYGNAPSRSKLAMVRS